LTVTVWTDVTHIHEKLTTVYRTVKLSLYGGSTGNVQGVFSTGLKWFFQAYLFLLFWKGIYVGLREDVENIFYMPIFSERAGVVSTARIEGPLLYRGASASTETVPAFSPLPF